MKKVCRGLALMGCILLFYGCAPKNRELEQGMALRRQVLAAKTCRFDAEVTADYGDKLYAFSMTCTGDSQGAMDFSVTAPETISGITGRISDAGGKLTFEETALQFPLMADDTLSPVSAPWIFLKTLRSGYLTSAGPDGEQLRLTIDDSYADDALQVDIWLKENVPVRAEILHDGRRILSMSIANFGVS